jgi:hypothetical protein
MAFDPQLSIPEQSRLDHVLRQIVATEQITPEEAATRLMTEGAKLHDGKKTPAEEMLGAFSSPEDVALMDEVMEIVHARRLADGPRDFGL